MAVLKGSIYLFWDFLIRLYVLYFTGGVNISKGYVGFINIFNRNTHIFSQIYIKITLF